MEPDEWLDPSDFILLAAEAEHWNEKDWSQWYALKSRLEELGVTGLKLRGPSLLSADHPGPFTSTWIREETGGTLGAVLNLVSQLTSKRGGGS